jgi:hypothetical protein
MSDSIKLDPFAFGREGISRRSALAGAAVASRTAVAAPAIGAISDGDAMALSLFRQWIAAANEYDRQAAADPDTEGHPASAVMENLEDRIIETSGGAVALAIKTYFKAPTEHGCWTPATADLRIEEAFQEPPYWDVTVSLSLLRAAAAVVPEIGELCAPVLHPDAALIDADIGVQWCRDWFARPVGRLTAESADRFNDDAASDWRRCSTASPAPRRRPRGALRSRRSTPSARRSWHDRRDTPGARLLIRCERISRSAAISSRKS